MLGPNEPDSQPSGERWGEIVVAVSTVVLALVGAKIPGLQWLIYVCIPLIFLAFTLMLAHSAIGTTVRKSWLRWRDRRTLKHYCREYCDLVNEASVADEMANHIDGLVWGTVSRPVHLYDRNSLYYLRNLIDQKRSGGDQIVLFVNLLLFEHIWYASGHLRECDRYIRADQIKFKDSDQAVVMSKLLTKFDGYCERHNRFCKRINADLRTTALMELSTVNLSFESQRTEPGPQHAG